MVGAFQTTADTQACDRVAFFQLLCTLGYQQDHIFDTILTHPLLYI